MTAWNPVPRVSNGQLLSATGYFNTLIGNVNLFSGEYQATRPLYLQQEWGRTWAGQFQKEPTFSAGAGFSRIFSGRSRMTSIYGGGSASTIVVSLIVKTPDYDCEFALEIDGKVIDKNTPGMTGMTYARGSDVITSITVPANIHEVGTREYFACHVNVRLVDSDGVPTDQRQNTVVICTRCATRFLPPIITLPVPDHVFEEGEWNQYRTALEYLRGYFDYPIAPCLGNYAQTNISWGANSRSQNMNNAFLAYQLDIRPPFHEPQQPITNDPTAPDAQRRQNMCTYVVGLQSTSMTGTGPDGWLARRGYVVTSSQLDTNTITLSFYDGSPLKTGDLIVLGSESAYRAKRTANYEVVQLTKNGSTFTLTRGVQGTKQVWTANRQCALVGENGVLFPITGSLFPSAEGFYAHRGTHITSVTSARFEAKTYYVSHTPDTEMQHAVNWRRLYISTDLSKPASKPAMPKAQHKHTVGGSGENHIDIDLLRTNIQSTPNGTLEYGTICPKRTPNQWGNVSNFTSVRKRRYLHVFTEAASDNSTPSPRIAYFLDGKWQEKSIPYEANQWVVVDMDSLDKLFYGVHYELLDVHWAFEQDIAD